MQSGETTGKPLWFYLIIFILFSVVLFWPSLFGIPFWDDWTFIFRTYRNEMTASNPLIFFPGGSEAKSWPVFFSVIWLMMKAFGNQYLLYHLTNIVLHGVNGFLFWRLLKRMRISNPLLWAMIYFAHPMHLFTVSWIIQLKTLLSIFFFLGCLHFLIDHFTHKSFLQLVLGLLFFTLALLSKATPVGFAFVMLLAIPIYKSKIDTKKFMVVFILPLLLVALFSAGRTLWSYNIRQWQKAETKTYTLLNDTDDLVEKLVMESKLFARYSAFVVAPLGGGHLFPKSTEINFSSLEFLLSVSVAIATIALVVHLYRRKLYLEYLGFIFFLTTILPFCGFFYVPIFALTNFVPYWLSIPALGLIPVGARYLSHKKVLIAIVIVFAAITHWQSYDFFNTEDLYKASVNNQPDNELIKMNLVEHYVNTHQCVKAQHLYDGLQTYKNTTLFNLNIKVKNCGTEQDISQ